jgi:hypothetical protein
MASGVRVVWLIGVAKNRAVPADRDGNDPSPPGLTGPNTGIGTDRTGTASRVL